MDITSTNPLRPCVLPGALAPAVSGRHKENERETVVLFDRFRDPVLRYVLAFGLSVHDAEEVTQEVFLALFRHLQIGRCRRNLRSWIFRVAHNIALKQRHANQKGPQLVDLDHPAAENHSDPSPSPESLASSNQARRRLLAVYRSLPEEDRLCLRLGAEGLRYREIAEVLEISLGGVSLSLARSLARLAPKRREGP